MHIRVYGVQADEMSTYEEAKVRYGFTFEFEAVPLSEKTAGDVKDCDALILLTNCIVNEPVAKVLASAGVRYLACRSAGSDHVDYSAVVRYGMKCCHVPAYAPEAISEHTIMLALEVLRHAKSSYQKVASGDFTLKGLKGRQLGMMTAGVLGTGRIGRVTMSLLNGFGTRVLGWDPFPNAEAARLCTYVEKETLLQTSDIIFLHCPLTEDSYHTICSDTLSKMKEGAVLINTARGGLVDLPAVLDALESGKLSGFGFDVYEHETDTIRKQVPLDDIHDPVFRALLQRDDTVYSAHVAFYTDTAILNMIEVTLDNLKEYEATGCCKNEINPQSF